MNPTFIQVRTYVADAARFGLTDEDQRVIEKLLLARPLAGSVVPGAGGLRKLRHAPQRSGGGKSGGVRVCYVIFPMFAAVYFIMAYAKNEQANLSAAQKKLMRALIREIEAALNASRP